MPTEAQKLKELQDIVYGVVLPKLRELEDAEVSKNLSDMRYRWVQLNSTQAAVADPCRNRKR